MYTALQKLRKDKDVEPSEFEETVAQALFDLENTNQEIKCDLKDLYINSAACLDPCSIPFEEIFLQDSSRLVRKLEKKFSGKEVILIATRRILRPPTKGSANSEASFPYSYCCARCYLEDIVYPTKIIGKGIIYKHDGPKTMKVFLDSKARTNMKNKLETFSRVYRTHSGKDVVFEFPVTES